MPARAATASKFTRTIRVNAPSRSYDALIGSGLLSRLGELVRDTSPGTGRAFLFFDADIPERIVDVARKSLHGSGIDLAELRVKVSERLKSLETLGEMLAALTRAKIERSHSVIALGGGILGDTAGFAAASYRRGVPWINCPTTLLAMVDASVGGKTAVNISVDHDLKKNMAGSFHQPSLVIADVDALASLPERFFRAGLAECIKHGLLGADWGDPGLLDWTEREADAILQRDAATLTELIARNIAIKARIVAGDEHEEAPDADGGRALLNLGHTFAHAIEPLPGLSPDGDPANAPLQHGEAVALGLVAACATAAHPKLHLASPDLTARIRSTLSRLGLPVQVVGIPPSGAMLAAMADDKKVASGKLRLVLPTNPGQCRVVKDPPQDAVLAGIDAIRA